MCREGNPEINSTGVHDILTASIRNPCYDSIKEHFKLNATLFCMHQKRQTNRQLARHAKYNIREGRNSASAFHHFTVRTLLPTDHLERKR
jgi:hypothetical protein